MRHIQSVLIGSVIAFLGVTNANANAIYQWHSTSPGSFVTATAGELVFTNAAYFSGSIDFYVSSSGGSPWIQYGGCPDHCRITNSPVISVTVTLDDGSVPQIHVEPGTENFTDPEQLPFSSILTFNNDGTLTGSLFVYDRAEQANASGSHYSWSVFNYLSDYFPDDPCGQSGCDVGDGYWQLARVTVPEPPVWPLFGLGVLGLSGLVSLRRNAQRRN